jgi:purine-nucleoside phosphorylase
VPIHLRAEAGDYAEACLLPGDPLRAQYIAETYLDNPIQRNHERGMLGYTGEFEGRPVSVQSTGMGCPSAAIVVEELIQLGVKRLLRVGTCGGLQPDLTLGDLIVALSAVRWSKRGVLAVEMEAAVLFTLGALRSVQAGCLLTVSDVVVEGDFKRISDEELRAAVDRMTRIALATATAEPKH